MAVAYDEISFNISVLHNLKTAHLQIIRFCCTIYTSETLLASVAMIASTEKCVELSADEKCLYCGLI